MVLKRLGVANVIAKAGSQLHGEILARVGADRVVFPERETGLRLAHSFNVPNVIDYLDVAPSFGIEKIRPPKSFIGQSLAELDLKGRLGLTPIALRRGQQVFVNPARDERLADGDEIPDTVTVRTADHEFRAVVRIDTPAEAAYYRQGGILQYVLRRLR